MKPIVHDLFSGLEGWGEGFVSEGYRVIGYDIVDMYKELGYQRPAWAELILCDVRSIHGSQCKDAAVIVASPPCQGYSYRAMPWKRAKALPPPDNTLFNECFRIQREASEAAGHYIPLIVENVRGAERWVGSARWHFGSYYLWGDVPALMPPTLILNMKSNSGTHERTEGAGRPRFISEEGRKIKGDWFSDPKSTCRRHGSKSKARKAASAEIAKIPFPLAQWIAKRFKPIEIELAGGESE